MSDTLPIKPKECIKDLNDFDKSNRSLFMSVSAKNIHKLKDLRIDNLWLIGANEKELKKILAHVDLKYLNLYQVLAKDLSILEMLNSVETIILEWNTKSDRLWDLNKNSKLRTLEITDFSKINSIDQLSQAKQIRHLKLSGGHGKAILLKSIEPLKHLSNLETLSLYNLKIEDDTLKPIGELVNLKKLNLSNQFDTKEYAWLSVKLPKTEGKMLQAVSTCNITDIDNKLKYDTMVTGRRKPFLLSTKDQAKIDKYIKDFEKLKTDISE